MIFENLDLECGLWDNDGIKIHVQYLDNVGMLLVGECIIYFKGNMADNLYTVAVFVFHRILC